MSTFDDNFPAKANPKMSDRVFGFDSEGQKNAGITNQALYDLFKGNLEGEFPTAASLLPAFDLDNIRVMTSTAPDNKIVKSNVLDPYTKGSITFKETSEVPTIVDGIINIFQGGKYYKRVLKEYNLGEFNVLPENSASQNATNFAFSQTVIPHDCKHILPTGIYPLNDIEITKSGIYDFSGVTLVNNQEVAGQAINISPSAEYVQIIGLKQQYIGEFYTNNPSGTNGVSKRAIQAQNKKTILTSCRASSFSNTAFYSTSENEAFYLINCTANNNGYAGCFSNGKDFQVLGGEYSYNGGSNTVRNGYGVVCNMYSGDSKIIGVTSIYNATRNLDSHVGKDLIFSNNYTSDAGQPHPQWFDIKAVDGLNIRVTQRIDRCIISNNICKRGSLAGISISGEGETDFLRNININNNILEDNSYQLHIRQFRSNRINIIGNQEINNRDVNFPVTRGLWINPISVSSDNKYLEELNLSDNSFDTFSEVSLTSTPTEHNKSTIKVSNNTYKDSLDFYLYTNVVTINCQGNNLYSVLFIDGDIKSSINFASNIIDVLGENKSFNIHSGFNGYIKSSNNILKDSTAKQQIQVPTNSEFINNTILISHEISTSVNDAVIRATGNNYKIAGNRIVYNGVTPFQRGLRFTANQTANIFDNDVGTVRIDHSGGSFTATRVTWDGVGKEYDFGSTSIPSLGDFVFPEGSVIKNNTGDFNRPSDWIVFNGVFIGRGFTKKGIRDLPNTSLVINSTYSDYYNVFSGSTSGGTLTVNTSQVPIGETVEGVVTGASKTFVEGSGFTIIRPTGMDLVIAQNQLFSLRFISNTQAVLTKW